jgi:hypothetical protein
MDAPKSDVPTSACPNCGTPRGPYDRFCTGCAADLGAPGSPIGIVGTLGVMNVAGPSSRQDRPQGSAPPVQRSLVGWVVPGSRSRPFAQSPAAPISAASQLGAMGRYPAAPAVSSGANRFWRTVSIGGRLFAVLWLLIMLGLVALFLETRPDRNAMFGWLGIMAVYFVLPSVILWVTSARVMEGEPTWVRSVALIELSLVVVLTLGLALVPLVLIFVFAGDEP